MEFGVSYRVPHIMDQKIVDVTIDNLGTDEITLLSVPARKGWFAIGKNQNKQTVRIIKLEPESPTERAQCRDKNRELVNQVREQFGL